MSNRRPLVICGPSGSGKSTLLKRLLKYYGEFISLSVSHTTRQPRSGEVDGVDYHFVSREVMQKAIDDGEFIEYTSFSNNLYGTSKNSVRDVIERGKICILDIEIEGVKNIKNSDLNARYVFIRPPTLQVLEERLRYRGTETETSLNLRLARATDEIAFGEQEGNFDLLIVNDIFMAAYNALESFLKRDLERLSGEQAEF